MERKTNVWVLENVKPKWTLESRVIKAALSYFGALQNCLKLAIVYLDSMLLKTTNRLSGKHDLVFIQ